MVGQGEEGEEEDEVRATVDSDNNDATAKETMGQAEQFDSRVTVCKPVSYHNVMEGWRRASDNNNSESRWYVAVGGGCAFRFCGSDTCTNVRPCLPLAAGTAVTCNSPKLARHIHLPSKQLVPVCLYRFPSPFNCTPSQDFIDRVAFNESSQVRFSVDGVDVSTVELAQQYGLYNGSCVLLDAQVGVGRHTVRVEPLKAGEPFVAISHVLYPA